TTMKKYGCPKSHLKGFVLVLLAWNAPALWHEAVAQQATATEESASGLQEVIVTAQKRAQNSQDIGIALSAVSGDQLEALGAVTASDITKTMPAVVLTQPNGPSSFSLS